MSERLSSLADLNRIIHEPARTLILTVLNTVEKADFLFLLNTTGLTRGNLSAHLARLEEAGYIRIEKTYRGKLPQTIVTLTETGLQEFDTYRKQIKELVDYQPED